MDCGVQKNPQGFAVKRRVGARLYFFDGFVIGEAIGGEGDRHGEQAREPRDVFAHELVGITVAVNPFVMAADDVADLVQMADERREFLAENRMLLDERAFRFGERIGIFLPAADDVARHADEADVVQQRGAFEHALLVRRQLGKLAHGAAQLRDAAGLIAERRIKRLHRVDAEFDRAK